MKQKNRIQRKAKKLRRKNSPISAILLYGTVFCLCAIGTVFCCLSGFGILISRGTLFIRLTGFLILTVIANCLPKRKLLSLLPFLIAIGIAVFSLQEVLVGLRLLLHGISDQFEALGHIAFYTETIETGSWDALSAVTKAMVLVFELHIALCGWAVLRHSSAAGLFLIELPVYLFLFFFAEAVDTWAILCVVIGNIALWVYSGSRNTGIVESGWNEAHSELEKEKQLQASLLPTQKLLALCSLPVLLLCAVLCLAALPRSGYVRPTGVERLRQTLTQTALFQSIFGVNDGLRAGQLQNLGDVRLTGESALSILPSEEQMLYLRGYAGAVYTDSRWVEADKAKYRTLSNSLNNLSAMNLHMALLSLQGNEDMGFSVSVRREGADADSVFLTNGLGTEVSALTNTKAVYDSSVQTRLFHSLWEYSFDAAPVTGSIAPVPLGEAGAADAYASAVERVVDTLPVNAYSQVYQMDAETYGMAAKAYMRYVYEVCTALPEDTSAAADALIGQYGLSLVKTADGAAIDVDATCSGIRKVLSSCTFTQTPAAIPKKEDFTTTFLNVNKEGYSTHFATAAVVLLRTLGIPARYAEGYLVLPSDYEKERDIDGYIPIEDTHAHAWAEVFDPTRMEWIPVEMIPGSGDPGEMESDTSGNEMEDAAPTPTPASDDTADATPDPSHEAEATPEPTIEPSESDADATPPPGEATEQDDIDGEDSSEESEDATQAPEDETLPDDAADAGDDSDDSDAGAASVEDGGNGASDQTQQAFEPVLWIVAAVIAITIAFFCGYLIPLRIRRKRLRQKDCGKAILFGCDHLYAVLTFLGVAPCAASDTPTGYAKRIHSQNKWLPLESMIAILKLAEQVRFAGYAGTKKDQAMLQRQLKALLSICKKNASRFQRLVLWYRYTV